MLRATYRLQLNNAFTFRDAARLVPYLSALGVSHCYLSPYLRARPGSQHGYDIIDHNALNPEIGTPEDYETLVAELKRHGMGQILDFVPNHMGVMGSDNSWWLDVLENGEASEYAQFFDIDWEPIKEELKDKVLVPILADQYGDELEKGKLRLSFGPERGEFNIYYHEHRFPIDPREYPRILTFQHDHQPETASAPSEEFLELQSIATAFGYLPGRQDLDPTQREERNREKEIQKKRLAALCERSAQVREALSERIQLLNGDVGEPRSFDALHELIKAQAYRLAHWRAAADDINYRRFFDINDLAALCMENDTVFEQTHRFLFELVAQGKIDGLRIDHPDGLYDPTRYFVQLRERLATVVPEAGKHIYVVIEKILTGNEVLRKDWPVDGTTGYEFANLVNGLFIDAAAADRMERVYRYFCGHTREYSKEIYACKKLILRSALSSELNVLANLLNRISLEDRHTCDFTLNSLRRALADIIACFPVYRTYLNGGAASGDDRRYLEQAVALGRRRSKAADLSIFDFVRRILLMEISEAAPQRYRRAVSRFAKKFQQVTAAVMAKGVEDTAFYRYNRLVSLNEVGGNPAKFGTRVEEFHRANQERLALWPNSMLSTSTHDSKRSEDVRARIDVLSEIPAEWRLRLRRWRDWNQNSKVTLDGDQAPSRNDEYLLYQTLVGAWPSGGVHDKDWPEFVKRIEDYMVKAAREAKEHTNWANTNADYESALKGFVRGILERTNNSAFLTDFEQFQRRIIQAGMLNSLSQSLLKMTSPGVPDIYQGEEFSVFNLVDPDNRRPVDYEHRRELLERMQRDCRSSHGALRCAKEAVANGEMDALKLFVTWKTLACRKENPLLFTQGKYVPLKVKGNRSHHLVAYARQAEGRSLLVVAPRLCAKLFDEDLAAFFDEALWRDTRIQTPDAVSTCYHNVFTGECTAIDRSAPSQIPAAKLLGNFPVALLLNT